MITVNSDGRHRSKRTEREVMDLIRQEMELMTSDERRAFAIALRNMQNGDYSLLDIAGQSRYVRTPVSMEQFLEDPYYLGESAKTLYPTIRRDLIESCDGHNYREMVLTGSIGYGKTTFLSFAMARMLYELSCLRSPQLAYGLSPGSEIGVALISKSLHLSRQVMRTAIEDKMKLSPYFTEHFPWKSNKDVSVFPNNVKLVIASFNSTRILGMNIVGGAMDEANFATSKKQVIQGSTRSLSQYDLAEKVYASLVMRIKSRFLNAPFDLPGLMMLVSSANTIGGFIDRKISDSKNDPTVFVRDYATWEVKPKGHFCGETFKVAIGSDSLRSKIIPATDLQSIALYEKEECRIIDVPIEYREDFERDLETAIRDVAGISTTAINAFIQRIEKIEECQTDLLEHPFTQLEWDFGTSGHIIWERIARMQKRKIRGQYEETYWTPLRQPNVGRWIHIDTSLSGDSTGFAMGYIDRWVEVVRRSPDGEEYADLQPKIVIEFMLRINPPEGEQIHLPDIRTLVYEIQEHGFHISGFSCDTYQSAEMLQQIKKRGIKGQIISVDRTVEPYERLKSAIYENRILMYNYPILIQELKALEYDKIKGKVDHPIAGSKDMGDAVAGVVQGLTTSAREKPVMLDTSADMNTSDTSWVTGKVMVTDSSSVNVPRKNAAPMPIIFG